MIVKQLYSSFNTHRKYKPPNVWQKHNKNLENVGRGSNIVYNVNPQLEKKKSIENRRLFINQQLYYFITESLEVMIQVILILSAER